MKIALHYCYDGSVPAKKGLYFCIYTDPEGAPTFGLARAEYNLDEKVWAWSPELAQPFGDSPPMAYMEVVGNCSDTIAYLEEIKSCYLEVVHD